MNYRDIAKDYNDAFGFNVIPLVDKVPKLADGGGWTRWQSEEMEIIDIDSLGWNSKTNGIGAISGINELRCLDFDDVADVQIVYDFADELGLGKNYSWIVKSGSGKGYHIWFRSKYEEGFLDGLGGKKAYYKIKPKDADSYDHIELRWENCQTVLPPSLHPSGNSYQYVNLQDGGLPHEEPKNINLGKVLETIKKFCVLEVESERSKVKSEGSATPRPLGMRELNVYERKLLKDAVDFIKGSIDNYDDWLRISFAFASLGEAGREYFINISMGNPKYPNDTLEVLNKKFDGFLNDYRGDITLGTFYEIAKKYGWVKPKNKKTDLFKATKEYISFYYDFRYNELTQKLSWKRKEENTFTEFNDSNLSTIYVRLKSDEKIPISFEDLRRILSSDFVPRFQPLIAYMDNLGKWDGYDYIEDLAKTVRCESEDQDLWKVHLRKWLVACVAGVQCDKEVNQTAIILQGTQGIGKTRWIKRLVPNELRDYLFTGNINPNEKDSKLAVVKNFIIDLDELETLNRNEIGFLKSLMTQKEIQIRKPYGHYEEKYIRRSSFIGSVNRRDFLNDMTGSRRFLPFEVIEMNADHNIDMDKVFSQALYLYRNGFEYWFNKDDSDEITKRNEKFTFNTMEEEKILGRYEPAAKDDMVAMFLTSTEIAEIIFEGRNITNAIIKQIGMAMHKNGFTKMSKRIKGKSMKKWIIKEI